MFIMSGVTVIPRGTVKAPTYLQDNSIILCLIVLKPLKEMFFFFIESGVPSRY